MKQKSFAGFDFDVYRKRTRKEDFLDIMDEIIPLTEKEKNSNRIKNSVRALVEYPFLVMKRIFGFEKVRYRGLYKNENHLYIICALINLYIQRRHLLALTG